MLFGNTPLYLLYCGHCRAELRAKLTVHQLAFLLFRVQVVAQVEDERKEEHEAGNGDDWHVLLTRQRTVVYLAPRIPRRVHLGKGGAKRKVRLLPKSRG